MIMKKDFILEIGTEELPLADLRHLSKELPSLAEKLFTEKNLSFQKILSFATSRRIVLSVKGIPGYQSNELIEVSGPPKGIAFDKEGNPTAAAKGFARAQKVKLSQLRIKHIGKKEVICAVKKKQGKPASFILKTLLPEFLRSISFPQSMRWSDTKFSFSRPIRWLLALLGEKTVKFKFEDLSSSNFTYGHRFLSPGPFRVKNPLFYFATLQKNFVILDSEIRTILIKKGLKGKKTDENLVREASDLVEYPTPLFCSIEKEYFKTLSKKIIESAIKREKGIPFEDEKGNLLPLFAVITNGVKNEKIKNSYEKVLEAKLADSKFFWEEDLKKPFEKYGEDLKKIIFHHRLGTTYNKIERIEKLATYLGQELKLKEDEIRSVKRGSLLCKNDLATQMVREFPELQGFIGRLYAEASGENKLTSQIIEEHYLPRFPGDALPVKKESMAVGIADRLIAICGYFIIGESLSGSSDPYGIKRLANGLVEIIWEKQLKLPLLPLLKEAVSLFPSTNENLKEQLLDFFKQRVNALLSQNDFSPDIRKAVILGDNLDAIRKKSIAIKKWKGTSSFSNSLITFSRVANILQQAKNRKLKLPAFRKESLKEEGEKKLFLTYQNIRRQLNELWRKEDYPVILEKLEELKPSINFFFDHILVMEKDEVLRDNRLALLSLINEELLKVADFSSLTTESTERKTK